MEVCGLNILAAIPAEEVIPTPTVAYSVDSPPGTAGLLRGRNLNQRPSAPSDHIKQHRLLFSTRAHYQFGSGLSVHVPGTDPTGVTTPRLEGLRHRGGRRDNPQVVPICAELAVLNMIRLAVPVDVY